MEKVTAVLDACVLFSPSLRDLLMQLAVIDVFRAKWSDIIHEEWIGNVLKNRSDLSRAKLERTRALMNSEARNSLVHGFESLIPKLSLPDSGDRHVLAAGIVSGATVIVTFNLKHFPNDALKEFGIRAMHPDDFVLSLMDRDIGGVLKAAGRHRDSLKFPPKSATEYLATLEKQNLHKTVQRLRAPLLEALI